MKNKQMQDPAKEPDDLLFVIIDPDKQCFAHSLSKKAASLRPEPHLVGGNRDVWVKLDHTILALYHGDLGSGFVEAVPLAYSAGQSEEPPGLNSDELAVLHQYSITATAAGREHG